MREVDALEDTVGADAIVVVNPNNPDGRELHRNELVQASRNLPQGGLLVVDEAFADFENGKSLAPVLPENTVVLRSFGKTYGLAEGPPWFRARPPAPGG